MNRYVKSASIFVFAYLCLLALSWKFGDAYVRLMLPLYRWEIHWLGAQDYEIQSLFLGEKHGEGVVMLSLLTRHMVLHGGHVPSGISITCSTLIGHALQHLLVMMSVIISWPASNVQQRLSRLGFAVPVLLLVEMLDIPLVLLGSYEYLLLVNIAPGSDTLMVDWMNFMNGGGRLALSLAAALAVVGGSGSDACLTGPSFFRDKR